MTDANKKAWEEHKKKYPGTFNPYKMPKAQACKVTDEQHTWALSRYVTDPPISQQTDLDVLKAIMYVNLYVKYQYRANKLSFEYIDACREFNEAKERYQRIDRLTVKIPKVTPQLTLQWNSL